MNRLGMAVLFLLTLWGAPAAAQNVDMGSTYHRLDRLVTRSVVDFQQARVVVERTATGSEAVLTGPQGDRALWIRSIDGLDAVEIGGPALDQGISRMVDGLPFGSVSTDWLAVQAYGLWIDRRPLDSSVPLADQFQWQGNLLRLRGAVEDLPDTGSQHLEFLRQEEIRIRTEFGALVAESVRTSPRAVVGTGGGVATASFTTTIFHAETGARLGLLRKFDRERVVVWDFPSVSSGWVSAETVRGGWTFDHNMAWANIQSLAFLLLRREQSAASMSGSISSQTLDGRWLSRRAGPRTPGLHWGAPRSLTGASETCDKQPDGCTGLHWLDDTIYKECCDQHDLCYYHPDEACCTAWSWLLLDPRWRCITCNMEAVWCFFTCNGCSGSPTGDDPCTVTGSGWCPAECFNCTYQAN